MRAYSANDLKRLVDLPATFIRALERDGHVRPQKANDSVLYTVRDLLVLRTASALRAARVPDRKISAALTKIREALPRGSSLSELFVATKGAEGVAIRGDTRRPESRSGQYALPLMIDHRSPSATRLKRRAAAERRRQDAHQHFERAVALEDSDAAAARAGYLLALAAHSEHLEARINLGRLLHLNGELAQAEKVYRAAKHSSALLSFNLATLLEDLGRGDEAAQAYRDALALDPTLHDAHFNLSRLHESADRPREALRHLLAYRRRITHES
jgi:tetratricopeptide (TPR) repeat protein